MIWGLCRSTSTKCVQVIYLRQGSNELDRSCSRERSSPVMLSAAKHLAADRDRPFASLRVTGCDESTCQAFFFTIEPCLKLIRSRVFNQRVAGERVSLLEGLMKYNIHAIL